MKCLLVCIMVCALSAPSALGGDDCGCCASCGCQSACTKVCRAVPGTKKVTKVEYSVKCEDFCVPGPSTRTHVCDECGHKKTVYTPTCAEVRTRKVLVKKEVVTKVPTTQWVVEDLCASCAAKCDAREEVKGEVLPNVDDAKKGAATPAEAPGGADVDTSVASHAPAKALIGVDMRRGLRSIFGEKFGPDR